MCDGDNELHEAVVRIKETIQVRSLAWCQADGLSAHLLIAYYYYSVLTPRIWNDLEDSGSVQREA